MVSDDAEVVTISQQRRLEAPVLTRHGFELQCTFNEHRHLIRRERLFDVVEGAALDGLDRDIE